MNVKFFYGAALALACMAGFTSCEDNDDPTPTPVDTTSGFYVINGGNKSGNIPGSVTAFDMTTLTATQDVFMAKNGQGIGDTPENGIIYGSKMYISVYRSNLIWVVDPTTLKIIKSISFDGDGKNPRGLEAKDGKVYTALYTGYVARIDTTTLAVDATLKVGNNPDQIAIAGNTLYVANSDGSQSKLGYPASSVSIIDLASFTGKEVKMGQNPTDMTSNGTDAFVICRGDYASNISVVKKINGEKADSICPGTNFAACGNELYVINSPYWSPSSGTPKPEYTYTVYNTLTGKKVRDMINGTIDSPAGIDVDAVTGNIVILSYNLDANGNSLYREPSYGVMFDKKGNEIKKFDCGVGAKSVVFRHISEVK